MKMPNYLYDEKDAMKNKLFEEVKNFMIENKITCEETIYQTDHVIENAYEFIEKLYHLVESELPDDDLS
jgi:hypothetical protein